MGANLISDKLRNQQHLKNNYKEYKKKEKAFCGGLVC